jgi:hypothetical protein
MMFAMYTTLLRHRGMSTLGISMLFSMGGWGESWDSPGYAASTTWLMESGCAFEPDD